MKGTREELRVGEKRCKLKRYKLKDEITTHGVSPDWSVSYYFLPQGNQRHAS